MMKMYCHISHFPVGHACPQSATMPAGPPGRGKSSRIKLEHCLCHLATGDMLRAAVTAKTELGMEVGGGTHSHSPSHTHTHMRTHLAHALGI